MKHLEIHWIIFHASISTVDIWGIVYFFILSGFGYAATKTLEFIKTHKKDEISDIEYDKNIK